MRDYWQDLENLTVRHRAKQALRNLMAAGSDATPVLRRGLQHPNAAVRVGCCVVLDHFLDEATVPELMANLEHEDEQVRKWALHALACDTCKEGSCRPAESEIVPIALRMLREDPSRRVRVEAVHLLGTVVTRHPEAVAALQVAQAADPDPNVRSVARRYTPGGAIYERLMPTHRVMTKVGPRRPYPRKRRRASLTLTH
ncbi:MAG TPA: HEAT repeat domain-containing protein [Dehalococcoidia bacterium]|nr:HEAT repeat domain-containing protein [Dehalococcoidia bacterium]